MSEKELLVALDVQLAVYDAVFSRRSMRTDSRWMIVMLVGLLLAFSARSAHAEEAPQRSPEVEVALTVEVETIEAGQKPVFRVRLINRTDRAIYLVGSLDASDVGWRYPKLTVDRTGPQPAAGLGRCGNMNNLREEDFVRVEPGASLDPYDPKHGFFSSYYLHDLPLETPGEYTFTLTYDSREGDIARWWGFMGPGEPNREMRRRFEQVPKGAYTSNSVTVIVTPKAAAPE
jgi:hypothetical protein